jgi:hypothetical protein
MGEENATALEGDSEAAGSDAAADGFEAAAASFWAGASATTLKCVLLVLVWVFGGDWGGMCPVPRPPSCRSRFGRVGRAR